MVKRLNKKPRSYNFTTDGAPFFFFFFFFFFICKKHQYPFFFFSSLLNSFSSSPYSGMYFSSFFFFLLNYFLINILYEFFFSHLSFRVMTFPSTVSIYGELSSSLKNGHVSNIKNKKILPCN